MGAIPPPNPDLDKFPPHWRDSVYRQQRATLERYRQYNASMALSLWLAMLFAVAIIWAAFLWSRT